jgi:glycosyltransferase involved in cell wall biosynthesis
MSLDPSVVYVVPDKMGGAMSIIANLLRYRTPDAFTYRAVLTHNRTHAEVRFGERLAADTQATVEYALPLENMYAVVRRLQHAIGPGPGVLVCNDFVDMLLVSLADPRRTVVQILHGDYDYYYDLASAHEPLVHAFVAYSRTVYDTLLKRLPHRTDTIFHLPYGIPLPDGVRHPAGGPLRLLFAGRLDEAKGVTDLPAIDRLLREAGVPVTWTVIGSGPAGPALRAAWGSAPHVRWIPTATSSQVVALCADHDVFVLPTHAEGLSVATVEAMSAGVVPVVSDLACMEELVEQGRTGLRAPARNAAAFAEAIASLSRDRDLLEGLSVAARRCAVERFDVRARAGSYQELYARWRELYRPRPASVTRSFGSRLDQPWMPNPLVRLVRTVMRVRQ